MNWCLDPELVFLNHGSFGSCPREILDEQQRWRRRMELNPMRFFLRDLEQLGDETRAEVGRFIGASGDDFAFVPNATFGVNAVARSLALAEDDEILMTDHAYNACANTLRALGRKVNVARIPLPIESDEQVIAAITAAVTPKTRLCLIDHVTSPTGLVWPVQRIIAALPGIDVLVDGAHAPGMLDLNVESLGAAYYVGNFHKWVCAPKGAAFLWWRRDLRERIHPPVVSHAANATRTDRPRFRLAFDWMGTLDPTSWLSIPLAIRSFDWPTVRAHNRALALEARQILCEALSVPPPAPESMIGSLAAVPLPDGDAVELQRKLWERGIEVPIPPWPAPPRRLVRISAQLYNHAKQYRQLAAALVDLI
jgi:isopenicillin-N epimerase